MRQAPAVCNRLEGCSLPILHDALYEKKILLQAWSVRGVPLVFPTDRSGVFLTALLAQEGEQPWIYTRGITAALDYMQMSFDDLLMRTKQAAGYLNSHTVRSKETLDQTLADIIECSLTEEKRALWRAPSMYGNPDRQTVGGAAVSFLFIPHCVWQKAGDNPDLYFFSKLDGPQTGRTGVYRGTGSQERVRKGTRANVSALLRPVRQGFLHGVAGLFRAAGPAALERG